ncbi:MAG: hypothetical protein A2579_02310 [Lysobacterales bacterium RIFOXYD1_FULL_69_11]|nr:MAG: hypothetical protein A2579_02310 [Xanthomonadales bacterium RIFOXYD1_FULL_69_11]
MLPCGIDSRGFINVSDTSPPSLSYSFGKLRSSEDCNCGWEKFTWLPSSAPTAPNVEHAASTSANTARSAARAALVDRRKRNGMEVCIGSILRGAGRHLSQRR